jgi:hypothetical protein
MPAAITQLSFFPQPYAMPFLSRYSRYAANKAHQLDVVCAAHRHYNGSPSVCHLVSLSPPAAQNPRLQNSLCICRGPQPPPWQRTLLLIGRACLPVLAEYFSLRRKYTCQQCITFISSQACCTAGSYPFHLVTAEGWPLLLLPMLPQRKPLWTPAKGCVPISWSGEAVQFKRA